MNVLPAGSKLNCRLVKQTVTEAESLPETY